MKRSILYLLFILLLSSCGNNHQTEKNGLTEKVIQYHKSGQPYIVYVYDSDSCWVREVEYYESGMKFMEGPIENNLRNGEWTSYHPDGKVKSTGVFKDGVSSGKSQVFWENGHLRIDGWYKNDERCGEWIFYDEQGYETERVNYGSCD